MACSQNPSLSASCLQLTRPSLEGGPEASDHALETPHSPLYADPYTPPATSHHKVRDVRGLGEVSALWGQRADVPAAAAWSLDPFGPQGPLVHGPLSLLPLGLGLPAPKVQRKPEVCSGHTRRKGGAGRGPSPPPGPAQGLSYHRLSPGSSSLR